ncbi:MAG: type II toxin-antitoxin system RelE/ParE family toxin [Planctomycetes bacterium]|nr:type II toxin-antitoxin system RelE/ParE family toxin [Planctomycetota bacterium]
MKIRFVRSAEPELLEIRDWYENRKPGLGGEFLQEVSSCLEAVEIDPVRFPAEETNVSSRDIRRSRLKKFPYRVIYELTPNDLRVLAIAHGSRQPGYWSERLEED